MPRTRTQTRPLTRVRLSPSPQLFRAFFGDDPFGTGGPPPSSSLSVNRALSLVQRLGTTFYNNPWTLVTLLSGLASLFSILESLVTIISLRTLVVALPITGIAVYGLAERRRIMTAHRGR